MQSTNNFAKSVSESFKQDNDITAGLLLAWLWKQCNDKIDFTIYLYALQKTINTGQIFNITPTLKDPFTKTDYARMKNKYIKLTEQMPSPWQSQEIIQTAPTQLPALEELLFYRYGYNLYEAPLPWPVQMTGDPFHNYNKKEDFPDCGETALRNFFNALLYNPITQTFDTEILKKLDAVKPLIDFYTLYKTAEKISTQQAHTDWIHVVSGLPNVEYNGEGGYGFEGKTQISSHTSGSKNMLKVIENLLPGIDSFDALAHKLAPLAISLQARGEPSD